MKKLRRFKRNKKAVSSIFIAIYLSMIGLLLISTLYVGQVISRTSITDYLKIEQERRQENILLYRFITDSDNRFVIYLEVKNIGAITVRLRALYINEIWVLDPSLLDGDAYIESKEALNITLTPPIDLDGPIYGNVLSAKWTVTTERGTKSSDLGMNLWEKTGGPIYSPNKFYSGPLMLIFDMFHWRSGTGPWKNGWSIPKSVTDVTWRILLTNVDTRPITITDPSCFTLVGNENNQNKIVSWFVDPELGTLTLMPGQYYFVYFTWVKPYSDASNTIQKPNALTVGIPCINFLTFTGFFTELDLTQTEFGQTIPFEAVLITDETMADSIGMTATPNNIRNDGVSTSSISATVTDSTGDPMPDIWVDLFTTAGTLSDNRVQTDENGVIQVILTSSTSKITAILYAMCEGVIGSCKVSFTPATQISVTANPNPIPITGNSTITVQLLDQNNVPVTQSDIIITVSSTFSANKPPILIYQTQSDTTVIVTTDSNGKAVITLVGQGKAGTATITASSSGLISGITTVTLE